MEKDCQPCNLAIPGPIMAVAMTKEGDKIATACAGKNEKSILIVHCVMFK